MLAFPQSPFSRQTDADRQRFLDWLAEADGRQLIAAEQALLAELLPSLVGGRALQLGVGATDDMLAASCVPWRWRLASCQAASASVMAEPAQLPFAKESIDLVLLHHSLDYDDKPYRIISEVARVLKPGGSLLVVGFNPFSLLGLKRWFRGRRLAPWSARYLRAGRVADWAGVCGCEALGSLAARPGSQHERGGWVRWQLERRLGSFYVLLARKQAVPLQPLLTRQSLMADLPPNVISVPQARWQQRTRNAFETGDDLQ